MPNPKPKPKKVGRPKLPKGEAKGKIVAMRFDQEDLKRIARELGQSKSDVYRELQRERARRR